MYFSTFSERSVDSKPSCKGMGRHARYVPEGGALVEISCRTLQGRKLFRPTEALRRIVVGILCRAMRRHPDVQLHAVVFLTNHYHLLLTVPDAILMASFMTYCNGLFARKLGPLVRWRGPVWARRYDAVLVAEEEASQVARLRYLLAHGVKEGLVLTPEDWTGPHCARALLRDGRLQGSWNKGCSSAALDKQRRKTRRVSSEIEDLELQLSPLPCWAHLPWEEIATRVRALIDGIIAEFKGLRSQPLGMRRLLRQNPHAPTPLKQRNPKPNFHGVTRAARDALLSARSLFLSTYQEASKEWRRGNYKAQFPSRCFRPSGGPTPRLNAA